jgi:pimeloyl-ACP methyl ester carboxylesterase
MSRQSISRYVQLGHLRHHLRVWNPDGGTLVLALHGMRDGSATFQFLVDALPTDWCIVAPDWRGHGKTEWDAEEYFFQHYLADFDKLLDHVSPRAPVRIVGHSMGGHVASVYAGLKPERVAALASLDGFGLYDEPPEFYLPRMRKWLAQRAAPVETPRSYPGIASMAKRLIAANPRLDDRKAMFMAENLSTASPDGTRRWAFDPKHRITHPYLFRFAEWASCFSQITAPVLWLGSGRPIPPGFNDDIIQERLRVFKDARYFHIPDTGHNLHQDAPERVAALLIPFLG